MAARPAKRKGRPKAPRYRIGETAQTAPAIQLGHAGRRAAVRSPWEGRKPLGADDIAARYGGDELTLVLPHTDLPAAIQVAENLRVKFSELEHRLDGISLKKTVSMGVATREGKGDIPRAEGLLKNDDEALYRAKQNDRNRVEAAE